VSPRQQFIDPIDLMISDGSKHVGWPSLWIDTLEMALAASGLDVPNVAV